MLETELKSLITKEIYDKVKSMYKWDSEKTQENHYYTDETGVLSKTRSVFRIRRKDGVPKIQVKTHKNYGSPLQICEENEFDCGGAPETVPAETGKRCTGLETGTLTKIGFNATDRCSYMWDKHTEICLDKPEYLGVTDYEIEVEYTNDRPEELLSELKSAGVELSAPSVGKYTRFVNRLREILSAGGD